MLSTEDEWTTEEEIQVNCSVSKQEKIWKFSKSILCL